MDTEPAVATESDMGLPDDPKLGAEHSSGSLFRPDVEGLRGVAILLVLLFHAALPLPGGFVGVDVFLVISGFLITGLLLRELETSGRIELLAFYGRRLRRLLPAAALVIAAVMPLAFVALPPLDRPGAMTDGGAAVLCVSNIRSALAAGDYFAAIGTPSPFLHFWSLSLEEQFYLVWPVLLLIAARCRRARLAAGITLLALLVVSLAASVVMTDVAPTWGFYSLPSRSWQFAAGGLLAVASPLLGRLPTRLVGVAGWFGVVGLAVAAVAIDGGTPYPGLLAVLPTGAAALLIVSGDRAWGPGILLRLSPLRFLGRISYSLYLWHWPILILPIAAGIVLEPIGTVGLLALAVCVAWLSWTLVEEPFRKARVPRRTMTRLSLQLGTAAIVGVVAWSITLEATANAAIAGIGDGSHSRASTAAMDAAPASVNGAVVGSARGGDGKPPVADATAEATTGPSSSATGSTPAQPTPGASVESPLLSPISSTFIATGRGPAMIKWQQIPAERLPRDTRLPRDVEPALGDARADRERLADDGCFTWLEGTRPADCVYGDAQADITIVLIGDSHAGHWFPAFNVLAKRNGWRLIPLVKASCPFIDIRVYHPNAAREYTECAAWRARAIRAANAARPDLVVVATAYRGIRPMAAADGSAKAQGEAMAREIGRLRAPAAIIVDSPRPNTDVPGCLSRHPTDVHECAIRRSEAFYVTFGARERIAATRSGAAIIDVVATVCPSTPCPVVRDGMILYRDGHHLTATFVRTLAPAFDAALRPLLASGSPASPAMPSDAPSMSPAPAASPSASARPRAVAALPAPSPRAATSPGAATSAAALVVRADVGPASAGLGGMEPVVATHPTDPTVFAVAYERRLPRATCSGASVEAALAISRDGGRSWAATPRRPWDGTTRASSYHSAIAWGPGPAPGTARLYWAGTTTRRCGGDLRVAVAWSDDAGKTWSRLRVLRSTPAWVGGMPDITVDGNPRSAGYGTVWVAYNYPLAKGRGSGLRIVASADLGRTWRDIGVPRAAAPAGFPATWRFGYRIRTGPDGTAVVSWYQADLRRWNPADVFERGTLANVGRIGFAVARVSFDGTHLRALGSSIATTVSRNAWTLGDRPAPGTRTHTYLDPMWSHGLDVDPVGGDVYLAIADYARGQGGPAGTVRIGRSTDRGRSWTWTALASPPTSRGRPQSVFRPGITVRAGVVVVGVRTIDEMTTAAVGADARIGAAWAISSDHGRTFTAPAVIPGSRWRSSVLAAWVNGPGTRDRLTLASDGTAVYAYGVGRGAATSRIAAPGTVQVALIRSQSPMPPVRTRCRSSLTGA
jgi:peptidoglycan/LPS O-acetylase OafA/YrhL